MKYFKVKDDVYIFTNCGNYSLVKNELITEKEKEKKYKGINEKYFQVVNIPKNKTFINFGCRFAVRRFVQSV